MGQQTSSSQKFQYSEFLQEPTPAAFLLRSRWANKGSTVLQLTLLTLRLLLDRTAVADRAAQRLPPSLNVPLVEAGTEPRMYTLLSFDLYGTVINTPPANAKAFGAIVRDAKAHHVEVDAFYKFWEERNISHYLEPYRSYKQICRTSLQETFEHFGIRSGNPDLIEHYFSVFGEMQLYSDVKETLRALKGRYRLAIVSNIDDDLFQSTPLDIDLDLVCTAERARGYKPDGTLFRYLLSRADLPVDAILHSGQSQLTDLVGGKPLGLTIAWINRRGLTLRDDVPRPDHILPDVASLIRLLG